MIKQITVESSDETIILNKEDLFDFSDVLGRIEYNKISSIKNNSDSTQMKIDKIISIKKHISKTIINTDTENHIKNYFSIDGAIKITDEDTQYLRQGIKLINEEGIQKNNSIHNDIINLFQDEFLLKKGNDYYFRNKDYYFLFDSIQIENTQKFDSINDIRIQNINIDSFEKEFYEHYNRIDQYLIIFSEYILHSIVDNIMQNINVFTEIGFTTIKTNLKQIKTYQFNDSPNEGFNNDMQEQIDKAVHVCDYTIKFIEHISKNHTREDIFSFISFITANKTTFEYINTTFGIDIDKLFRGFFNINIPEPINKVILGLIDEKINMTAFMQNICQIITNKNFLNKDFEGDLVLNKNQTKHINKISPLVIENFKKQQKIIINNENNISLSISLDMNIGFYLDLLMGDKQEAYIYSIMGINFNVPCITQGLSNEPVKEFESIFKLLKLLYSSIEKYGQDLDKYSKIKRKRNIKKHKKRLKKGLNSQLPDKIKPLSNKNYIDTLNNVNKRLIRFHREENNPLTIIKTAQNAFIHINNNGYSNDDNIHILSVNYGGSIIGYYAKHIFKKMNDSNRILITIGNIVYSIYDLKNVNSFLEIVDYPFKEYIHNTNDNKMKEYHKSNNHLLIFDDNSSSGKTLHNLSELAGKTDCYKKINIFACRSSNKYQCYDDKLSDEMILDIVSNSAISVKKIRFGKVRRGYKELIGTIIGENIRNADS